MRHAGVAGALAGARLFLRRTIGLGDVWREEEIRASCGGTVRRGCLAVGGGRGGEERAGPRRQDVGLLGFSILSSHITLFLVVFPDFKRASISTWCFLTIWVFKNDFLKL